MNRRGFPETKKSAIYETAKKVYNSSMKKTEAKAEMSRFDVSPRAVTGYIMQFKAMREGERYTTCCSAEMTRYFLDRVKEDYGNEALKIALDAVKHHADYLAQPFKDILSDYGG